MKCLLVLALLALQLAAHHACADTSTLQNGLPPEYYEAADLKRNGIIFTSVVSAPGMLLVIRGIFDVGFGQSAKYLAMGLAVTGVGVGVGVPMIVRGTKQKRRIKREWLLRQKTSDVDGVYYGVALIGDDPALSMELDF